MLFIQFFLQIPLTTIVHRVLAALRILFIPTIFRLQFAFWNIRRKIESIRLSSRNYAHYYEIPLSAPVYYSLQDNELIREAYAIL